MTVWAVFYPIPPYRGLSCLCSSRELAERYASHRSEDAAFLVEHGWRYMTRSRYTYGWHYYWDHDKYRPRTGYWLTQGEAVRIQKAVNKRRATPDGGRCA